MLQTAITPASVAFAGTGSVMHVRSRRADTATTTARW